MDKDFDYNKIDDEVNKYSYAMQKIEQPYDAYEQSLIQQIEAIQREAYDRAEPYRNAFVSSRLRKTAKYVLMREDQTTAQREE